MVRDHFQQYYGIPNERLRVVRSAIDPDRFADQDRTKRRQEWRRNGRCATTKSSDCSRP